eukprot:UN03063
MILYLYPAISFLMKKQIDFPRIVLTLDHYSNVLV